MTSMGMKRKTIFPTLITKNDATIISLQDRGFNIFITLFYF